MARRGKPGVLTVGDRHAYPRSEWGSEDWAAEERLQAPPGQELGTWGVIPPPGPQIASGFSLFAKPSTARDARGRAIDKLIEKHVGRR